jgi:hypothetical protein
MRRRHLLRAALAGAASGLAGCLGAAPTADTATPTPTPDGSSVGGVSLPVPSDEIRTAVAEDHIPAITDPAFAADWSGLDAPDDAERPLLPDDAPVIGVASDAAARAYPLRVLDYHEVVNDAFPAGGGEDGAGRSGSDEPDGTLGGPLLVTYCPLCGSGVVAERFVAGEPTQFGVSGKLWRSDLVLYDRATDTLWSQLLAAAIRGPMVGERLSVLPSTLTTWGEWQRAHPDGEVLLPPPRSDTVRGRDLAYDYFDPKYGYGDEAQVVGYDSSGDLAGKTLVLGIEHGGVARAYPFGAVADAGVVNDRVGDLPVAVTATPGGSMAGYVRAVDGGVLRFEPADDRQLAAGGSCWERTTGRAVDGPHEGTRLDRATDASPMFWHAWSSFHPDTEVYGRG